MRHLNVLPLLLLFSIITASLDAQIDADFTANTQQGCNFAQVNFTNTSTDGGTAIDCQSGYSYTWNFNPGGSTECSPGNIFSDPGSYTICLTVTNDNTGESNTECKNDFIVIHPLPTPSFSTTPDTGCEPLQVCFQNTTTLTSGTFTSCIWDFGDGEVLQDCSMEPICHTYAQAGSYQATLTLLDSNGCPAVTASDSVNVSSAPEISVSADTTFSCNAPLSVTFSNNSPVTNNITFNWQFEGANTATFSGVTPPAVVYETPGSYDVTITAESAEGCSTTQVLENYITIGENPTFTVSDYSICLGESVTFTNTFNAPTDSILWNFGDNVGTSSNSVATYTYTSAGCYPVSLTVYTNQCTITRTDTMCIQVSEVPTVSFTNDNPTGCAIPHVVNFTSLGAASSGTFAWDFAGLGTSSVANPSFSFTEFGSYPVTLTYTSPDSCTVVFKDTININAIQVSLVGSKVDGCVPKTVTLQESSSSLSSPITNWEWTIPNVGTFTEQSPSFSVTDTGNYDVILQVTNADGCMGRDTFENHIEVGESQPVDFTLAPPVACLDTAINFQQFSSEHVDRWFWSFGDGSTSEEPYPVHIYSDTGYFQVCLTVFHNGCPNTECKPDIVRLLPPKAILEVQQNCLEPYTYTFESNSLAADSLSWDFGDENVTNDTSSLDSLTYTYSSKGSYMIRLVAYNFETGCTDTARTTIVVTEPNAIASTSDTIACAPYVITPTNASVDAVSWAWTSLSGGGVITGANTPTPSISYPTQGQYNNDIQLIISDLNGCQDTVVIQHQLTVNDIVPNFTFSPDSGCAPLVVNFTDASTTTFSNIVNYDWSDSAGNTQSGASNTASFTYDTAGGYNVNLTLTDALGCTASLTLQDTVFITSPTASFTTDTVACTGQFKEFQNTSTGTGLSYTWSFGDGNTSTVQHPNHSYASEGTYNVCLDVVDVNGCTSQSCITLIVANTVASFTADTTYSQCPPLVVNFTNNSTNAVSGGSTWDFGDNTNSNGDNPAHVYTRPGVFDVSLVVTGASGCKDTMTIPNYITLSGPTGSFSFNKLEGCSPTTVTFVSSSQAPNLHIMDYGNGVIDSSSTAVLVDTFRYTYTQAGLYTPALILVDDLGCNRVFDADSTIRIEALDIDFTASDSLLCGGGLTNFSSQITSTDPVTFLQWTFEGQTSSTSNALNPVNLAYPNNGTYDVTLVVDNGLCRDSITKKDYITVEPNPVANFTISASQVCQGEPVSFTNTSTAPLSTLGDFSWDFGDNTTKDTLNNNPSYTYVNPGSYTVELEVSTQDGCQDTTSQVISVIENPDVVIAPAPALCIGDSTTLNASLNSNPQGVTYSWNNGATLSCTDCLNPVASPTATTTYTVTVTKQGTSCIDTAQVTVTVLPFSVPNIGLGADTSICEGSTIQLIAGAGAGSPFVFQWDTSAVGLSCYDCSNPFATPTANTQYQVTVTGPGGCSGTDEINVSIFDPSQDFVSQVDTICQGESTQLSSGNFGTNPEWRPSTGLNCVFCPTPIASPNETMVYYVYVDHPTSGCRIYDSVKVEVIPAASIDAGMDTTVCVGDQVQLQGRGIGALSWTPSSLLNSDTVANPMASPTQATTFYLAATIGNCVLKDSVKISTIDSITLDAVDASICIGDSITLTAGGNGVAYTWSPALHLSNPNVANPIFTGTETTDYTVKATMGSCPSATANITVTVNPIPGASLYPQYTYYKGVPISINIENVTAPANYLWTPSDGLSCSDCQAPKVAPDSSTTYTVLVTDRKTGCQKTISTAVIRLDVCDGEIIAVPNAFTPNGDGQNDILYVRGSAVGDINVFRVFDRWGKLMFETTNMSMGWDGTYDGKPLNSGVYVYYVEATCPVDGSKMLKKGNITLLR